MTCSSSARSSSSTYLPFAVAQCMLDCRMQAECELYAQRYNTLEVPNKVDSFFSLCSVYHMTCPSFVIWFMSFVAPASPSVRDTCREQVCFIETAMVNIHDMNLELPITGTIENLIEVASFFTLPPGPLSQQVHVYRYIFSVYIAHFIYRVFSADSSECSHANACRDSDLARPHEVLLVVHVPPMTGQL